jgi:hypothetical protein
VSAFEAADAVAILNYNRKCDGHQCIFEKKKKEQEEEND